MKNYQIEFILKIQEGNSYKLEQQIISVEALNHKDALKIATKKLYKPKNFIAVDNIEIIDDDFFNYVNNMLLAQKEDRILGNI